MNWGINTNISEIPKAKSLFFEISNNIDNSPKNRPITSRINLKSKNNYKLIPKTPKISNYGFTPTHRQKLFSINDIKEKYLSKAPNLPNQFKRKIYDNINNLLYNKSTQGLIFKIPQIEYNKEKSFDEENNFYKRKSKSLEHHDKLLLKMGRKERLFKPRCWDNATFEDIKKNQRDKLMPEGYEFYEKNILEGSKNYIKNNYVKINRNFIKLNKRNNANTNIDSGKEKILIRKLNRLNQYKSNIFFNEPMNIDGNKTCRPVIKLEKKKVLYKKYLDSDIFNLRNSKNILEKSGEYSYINAKNLKQFKYNVNNETLLGWKLRKPLPSFLNYSSSKYSLFNRDMRNSGKTKEDIINEVRKINNNFNPAHKQKGLTEFIELSRVSAQNINADYNKALSDDPNIFKKKNNLSTEFLDLHTKYNNLCDKPFQKFSNLI